MKASNVETCRTLSSGVEESGISSIPTTDWYVLELRDRRIRVGYFSVFRTFKTPAGILIDLQESVPLALFSCNSSFKQSAFPFALLCWQTCHLAGESKTK